MTVKEAIAARRSVRKYENRGVGDEDLLAVLDAAKRAPSAMNNQSRQFVAIADRALLDRLNAAVESITDDAVATRIKNRSAENKFDFFYGAPVLILACDDPACYRPYEDCACALENMFLMATELGLGTCWINQLTDTCDKPAIAAVLKDAGMKDGYRVYGCCALGYAADEPVARNKTNEIVIARGNEIAVIK